MKFYSLLLLVFLAFGCKNPTQTTPGQDTSGITIPINHAQGFYLTAYEHYTELGVTKAFPGATDTLKYALFQDTLKHKSLIRDLTLSGLKSVLQVPIKSIVVTSTTHIPSLEMLEVENSLVGFPNLDYISSQRTRNRIAQGEIKELGQNESLNTEVAVDLNPNAVIGFGVDGQNKSLNSLEKAQIPVLYNGDWVEKSPLGKAEWIKFFGALYARQEMADSIFNVIESQYLQTKKLAQKSSKEPTVLSGAMYKDVWYLPHGQSWPAQLIKDAGGKYLWSETEGSGSISLSIESVLDKGQNAEFWIAPGQYTSYSKLQSDNAVYSKFDAFQNKKIYTFATVKGETGGMLYYELAPNRPDLVLKDIVHYLHPELLSEYKPYFFTPFDD